MHGLCLDDVLMIHNTVIEQSGGARGILDLNGLQSALAQSAMTFNGVELYPTLVEKAAAVAHSIIANHPFVDGNKRVGHAVLEIMLVLGGFEIVATIEEQEQLILAIASGRTGRQVLARWLNEHIKMIS